MKTKIHLVLIIIFLYSGLVNGQDLQKGIWYLKQDQHASAKRIFLALAQKDTTDAKALYYAGQVYFLQENLDSALYFYQNGAIANPKEPLNYLGLGKIQLLVSNRAQWVDYYDKGRKVAVDLPLFNLEAANASIETGAEYSDLVNSYLEQAKDKMPKNPQVYISYGNFYMKKKNPGDAVNEYERAAYYDKNCVEAYLKEGVVYAKANNFKDAILAFNNAINIDPLQILGYKLRGDLYYTFAKYQEALSDYDIYMDRSDENLIDHQKYIFILFFAKDYERASGHIDNLLASHPELTILNRIKAYIDYETGNYPEGLKNLEIFFREHDTTKFIALDYIYYGRLLIKNELDSLGTVALEKAIIMDSTKVDVYEDLAKAYSKLKKFPESTAAYRRMLIVNPQNVQNIYYQIGRNYYFMAEDTATNADSLQRVAFYNQADSNFLMVTELNPDSYIGFIWRGRVHSRLDPETSLGLAKPDYEQALVILEKGDISKTPKLLIECYRYLAYYYYLVSDKTFKTDPPESKLAMANSIDYWNKVLALDPNDAQAKTALDNLKIN